MQTQKFNMDRYIEFMGLISIMLLSTATAGCPSKCICLKNAVKCSRRSLMNVPNFQRLENNPVTIDLSSNEIDFISYDDFSFDKVDVVEVLILNESKIIDIDDTTFKELTNLRALDLSRNLLGQLPQNSFEYNSKLVYIDLSYNLFRIMPKLISESLETLLLRNAGIEKINNDNFERIPNLKYLNLQRNSIKFIDPKIFRDVPKLRLIQLENNHWRCTCKSVELFNFLQEHSVLNIVDPIQCKSGEDLSVSFFTENGVLDPIKDICERNKNHASYNFVGNYLEPKEKEIFNQRRSAKTHPEKRKLNRREKNKLNTTDPVVRMLNESRSNMMCPTHHGLISTFTASNYIYLSIPVILAYIVGLISGLFFARMRNNKSSDNRSSCDSLLRKGIGI